MASRNSSVTVRAAFIGGGFLLVAALISGAFQLFSVAPENVVQQGDAPQTIVRDIKDSKVNVTVSGESEEAREARRQAERRRQNKTYMVSVSRWVKDTYAPPGGRSRSVNRPIIESIPSATKPTFKLNEDKSKYLVEVTQFVDDRNAEGDTRLDRRTIESDASFGEPTIEGPFE